GHPRPPRPGPRTASLDGSVGSTWRGGGPARRPEATYGCGSAPGSDRLPLRRHVVLGVPWRTRVPVTPKCLSGAADPPDADRGDRAEQRRGDQERPRAVQELTAAIGELQVLVDDDRGDREAR